MVTFKTRSSKIRLFTIVGIIVCLFLGTEAEAQRNRKYKRKFRRSSSRTSRYTGNVSRLTRVKNYYTLGASINSLNYFGDLAPQTSLGADFSFTRPGFGLSMSYRLGSALSLKAELMYGRIQGDDNVTANPEGENSGELGRYQRNLHFRNDIIEFSIVGRYDVFPNYDNAARRTSFTPYIYAGIAPFYHSPEAKVSEQSQLDQAGQWVALQPLGLEGQNSDRYETDPYSRIAFAIPAGIGFRMTLAGTLDLEIEFGYRFPFTDYLDDVSQTYVDPGIFDDPLARELYDRTLERTATVTGNDRSQFLPRATTHVSQVDPELPPYQSGVGYESPVRGNSDNNDLYLVTAIRLRYIIPNLF
jgi:hypothetical protein